MINFVKHTLANGLRVVVNRDTATPMAVVNLLYDVGARDENPDKTGLAHLFEHLMFEGSLHAPDFDNALQLAGGENNAFTSNDITNYYINLPSVNLETALWLESDRMLNLTASEEKLAIQKNVVIEEYRQVYLNQPYGDANMLLRKQSYQVHPYQWSTIGKNIDHIRSFDLGDIQHFYQHYYHPANAILSISSPLEEEKVLGLAEKWFGDIPSRAAPPRTLPIEPNQEVIRRQIVERDVPADHIYMAFHTVGRTHPDFFATDLLSDILANGASSRLKQSLVNEKKFFSDINAYISGSIDTGMFVITGKIHPGVAIELAEEAIWQELDALSQYEISAQELQKIKNKLEAAHIFSESSLMARTINLAYYELLGGAGLINEQVPLYFHLGSADLKLMASKLFQRSRATILHYLSKLS